MNKREREAESHSRDIDRMSEQSGIFPPSAEGDRTSLLLAGFRYQLLGIVTQQHSHSTTMFLFFSPLSVGEEMMMMPSSHVAKKEGGESKM